MEPGVEVPLLLSVFLSEVDHFSRDDLMVLRQRKVVLLLFME